mgnify:FL=1
MTSLRFLSSPMLVIPAASSFTTSVLYSGSISPLVICCLLPFSMTLCGLVEDLITTISATQCCQVSLFLNVAANCAQYVQYLCASVATGREKCIESLYGRGKWRLLLKHSDTGNTTSISMAERHLITESDRDISRILARQRICMKQSQQNANQIFDKYDSKRR